MNIAHETDMITAGESLGCSRSESKRLWMAVARLPRMKVGRMGSSNLIHVQKIEGIREIQWASESHGPTSTLCPINIQTREHSTEGPHRTTEKQIDLTIGKSFWRDHEMPEAGYISLEILQYM